MHLEDCRESAYKGVGHGLRVLDSISKWVDIQQMSQPLCHAGESFQSRLATFQCDLDFFRHQFPKVGKEVKELLQTLLEHLESHTYIIYRASQIGLIALCSIVVY